jgi:exodeoxyribonuclease V alpha subunit
LTRIFRQGPGSGIARDAERIKSGHTPLFRGEAADSFFLEVDIAAAAADLVVELVAERLPRRYGFARGEIQVLVPMHRGEAGVGALNSRLQDRLNPARDGQTEVRSGGRTFRAGDRVLQMRNDYDLKVFNGDLGTLGPLDPVEHEVMVYLDDGREVRYPVPSLFAVTHAFAISVHKAQGAEFPAVVLPLLTNHAMMLGRTLLYTAFTRARRLVVVVGQRKALGLAVRDWRRAARTTSLEGLLTGALALRWQSQGDFAAPPTDDLADAWEGLLSGDAEP